MNPAGYSYELCYMCSITQNTISITNIFVKKIVISAFPLDCTASLVDAGFANPAPIAYNSVGSVITVIADYTDIFTHN